MHIISLSVRKALVCPPSTCLPSLRKFKLANFAPYFVMYLLALIS